MVGGLLLWTLTFWALLAALAVAKRLEPEGRAESAVVVLLVFYGIIFTPIFVLGYAGWLYRSWLSLLSFGLSTALILGCKGNRGWRRAGSDLVALARRIATLASEGLTLSYKARSFTLAGILVTGLVLSGSFLLTYVVPADESWDGLYYHQPIVGFALQNHGFRTVELPQVLIAQAINGYPRLCEAVALWFVVFTDKTWIEVGNSLAAPGLVLAIFLLVRRYSPDPLPAMAWAAVGLLMPGMYAQLRTTMVDVQFWCFGLLALYFATKPVLHAKDAAMAFLASALVVGTKGTGLTVALPPIIAICVRCWWRPSTDRRWMFVVALLGLLGVGIVAALTLVHNWLSFKNPFWPVSYENALLGVSFPGLATLSQITPDPPLRGIIAQEFGVPIGGVGDLIRRDYGYAVPWLVLPLGAISFLALLVAGCRGVLRRKRDPVTENLILVALLILASLLATPALSNARFNTHAVVLCMLCIAWAATRMRDSVRFHEGATAGALMLSIVPWFWSDFYFGLGLTPQKIRDMLSHSAAERASMTFSGVELPPDMARLRERELRAGDLVVFNQELTFLGVLWNREMSNRVAYVPFRAPAIFLGELARRRPTWVMVGARGPARRALERSGGWEYVGTGARHDNSVIFRRREQI